MKENIIIRKAVVEDAPLLAAAVTMAIGGDGVALQYCGEEHITILTEIARSEATQYSWQNALIAEVNGQAAGAIIGYDGGQLEQLRSHTLGIIKTHTGSAPAMPDETKVGEYYLDTLAVIPEYRGHGIAKRLIKAFCDKAFAQGYKHVDLLVDYDNPLAERIYTSIGFTYVDTRLFLGIPMKHLQLTEEANELGKSPQ